MLLVVMSILHTHTKDVNIRVLVDLYNVRYGVMNEQ